MNKPIKNRPELPDEVLANWRCALADEWANDPTLSKEIRNVEFLLGEVERLREEREELRSCIREGHRLFHPEQGPGTVGQRWCRWAKELGFTAAPRGTRWAVTTPRLVQVSAIPAEQLLDPLCRLVEKVPPPTVLPEPEAFPKGDHP